MESAAYKETYGDHKVWELYRRNFHKGKTYMPTRPSWCERHRKSFIPNTNNISIA